MFGGNKWNYDVYIRKQIGTSNQRVWMRFLVLTYNVEQNIKAGPGEVGTVDVKHCFIIHLNELIVNIHLNKINFNY